MMHRTMLRFIRPTAVLLVAVALSGGCQSPPSRSPTPEPVLQTSPSTAPEVTEAQPPSTSISETRPAPEETHPVPSPPPPEAPKPPDYVEVLELFHPDEAPLIDVQITSRHRLVIDTRNVRRLRILRHKLPMDTARSIVLHLDGQGIEWTADSPATEFERGVNGAWNAAPPPKP